MITDRKQQCKSNSAKENKGRVPVTGHALSGKVSEIHDKMLAGTMLQIYYNVRTRIYPRSQSVPRLAFFAED